jgi:DNA repair protein RecO (recombination protein O)
MPVYKVNAIVLRRSDLGETDRILRLLTRETGKVDAVAKGARRGTSRLSGATELFTFSRMLLAVGKSLDIVSQCEIRESFPTLRTGLPTLARAAYLCELADRFAEEREPNPDLFDSLLSALYLLQRNPADPDVIIHSFELHLLSERGYHPELERCVRCGGEVSGSRAGFSPSLGGALCTADRFAADDTIQVASAVLEYMRRFLQAEPAELVALSPDSRVMKQIGQCLRWYIRYRSERDLNSAEFLDMLRITGEPRGSRV